MDKGRKRERNKEEEEETFELEKARERQQTRMGQQSHREHEDQKRYSQNLAMDTV